MNNQLIVLNQRYKVLETLHQHHGNNRSTYLAKDLQFNEQVIIKEFKFLKTVEWKNFKDYEREVNILKSLNHPYISQYLDSFETEKSLCLVQKYISGKSLAISRTFTPEDIKKIALNILDILIYLQAQTPPIIHRDIKPENILIDDNLNTYLIDFGLSSFGNQERGKSSVAAGTFGFMAPEQIYNKTLTKATDLYGLGMTLICLLTGTRSTDIQHLINDDNILSFHEQLPPINSAFINWLEKLTKINHKERYFSAKAAYNGLKIIQVDYTKEVVLKELRLKIHEKELDQTIIKVLKTKTVIPKKVRTGVWEFIPHPNDPFSKVDSHPWLKINPSKFEINQSQTTLSINPQNLMRNRVYERQICLHTYEDEEVNYILALKIFIPPLNLINIKHHFFVLVISWLLSFLITFHVTINQEWLRILITVYLFIVTAFIGFKITWKNIRVGLLAVASLMTLSPFLGVFYSNINESFPSDYIQFINNFLKVSITMSFGIFLGALSEKFIKFSKKKSQFTWQSLSQPFHRFYLISALGMSSLSAITFSLIFTVGSWKPLILLVFLASTSVLAFITYRNPMKYYQKIQKYQKKQKQGKLIQS
ncbi:serine/threonine protein kinase [Crocosphaera chwakensis]|uniref:Serine/threonine kinase n=1 Tax=Crocosphaera chwakensis CCY0110 TaxID=391612 RepID=A3INR5_9CHRO|nr:serine/threonine-protein kinase [Crocosphaera chwakensis]EAZ91963.1 serine/threonine kinase [Crocosphaera chwakensis CCY0110]